MKIIFIADFFANQIVGGGELNNEEFIDLCLQEGHDIEKINSHLVTIEYLKNNRDVHFIVGNFINLNQACKDFLTNCTRYVIYEHDHKYIKNRNPAVFKNFIAPKTMIVNTAFYKNAKAVLCQSKFHVEIIRKNLDFDNVVNLGGNFWSLSVLENMKTLSLRKKNDKCSIMDSNIPHKNTSGSIEYCKKRNIEYDLIGSCEYFDFLEKMSQNDKFIFLPKSPETLSRVVVEARMMGMKVITNSLVGATSEEWFQSKGEKLIELMINKRKDILEKILINLEK